MPDLTDEEYDALDEYYTKNLPRVSGNGRSGSFAQHEGHVVFVDDLSADWHGGYSVIISTNFGYCQGSNHYI
ncbi:hypothetical protein AGMMS49928_16830 [Spirochaetia bacterium]|nr:hypothetical protein AGMMS49928_16830 [Spirochaetia bacterium]